MISFDAILSPPYKEISLTVKDIYSKSFSIHIFAYNQKFTADQSEIQQKECCLRVGLRIPWGKNLVATSFYCALADPRIIPAAQNFNPSFSAASTNRLWRVTRSKYVFRALKVSAIARCRLKPHPPDILLCSTSSQFQPFLCFLKMWRNCKKLRQTCCLLKLFPRVSLSMGPAKRFRNGYFCCK